MPEVSVVLAMFNAARHLDAFVPMLTEAIADVDAEVIVVDDGSVDGSAPRLRDLLGGDQRFRVLELEHNGGVAAARNHALSHISGDFVWFCDIDDTFESTVLVRLLEVVRSSGADLAICRADYRTDPKVAGRIIDGVDADLVEPSSATLRRVLMGEIHGFLWTKLFARNAIGEQRFPIMTSQSDFPGFVRFLSAATTVALLPDVLYHYVNTPGSITRVRKPKLDNLEKARDAMLTAVANFPELQSDSGALTTFDVRFYRLASALVPIRQNADPQTVDLGLRRARQQIEDVDLRALPKNLAVATAFLRWSGPTFVPVTRKLYAAHDAMVAARVRVRAKGIGR
ncbi:glycosyltransferase family 2 protein [Dermacoccaceae bacterium W4C1]